MIVLYIAWGNRDTSHFYKAESLKFKANKDEVSAFYSVAAYPERSISIYHDEGEVCF